MTDFFPRAAVVVGGGIAGLVTAWELARAGLDPLLLEAADTVGGTVGRHTVGGLELDSGAESYATATPAVTDLLTELGLAARIVTPNPVGAWVRHAGGSAPLPEATLLGIPSRPFAADVRRVLGVGGAARACLDQWLPVRIGADGDGSLGSLVAARMGRAVVTRLVEPVAGGVYSTDPDELDVQAVAPRLLAALRDSGSLSGAVGRLRGSSARPGSAVGGVAGGLFSLVDALSAAITALGGTVLTGVMVKELRPVAGGWRVRTARGSLTTAQVVLALPGPAATVVLDQVGISVPVAVVATSDVLLVTLVVDSVHLDAHPRGTGVLVSSGARGVTAKALTHATAKWPWLAERAGAGRHVLRLSYGRGTGPLPTEHHLPALALDDASTLTGIGLTAGDVVDHDVIRWTSALPRPQPGHRAAMDGVRHQVAQRPGLSLTGSVVAGTGLAAVVADARNVAGAVITRA